MNIFKYSIFDSKASTYNSPFYAANQAVALRMLAQAANSPDSMLGAYPDDYTLYELSTFDPETGLEVEHKPFKNLGQPARYHAEAAPENLEANQRDSFQGKSPTQIPITTINTTPMRNR